MLKRNENRPLSTRGKIERRYAKKDKIVLNERKEEDTSDGRMTNECESVDEFGKEDLKRRTTKKNRNSVNEMMMMMMMGGRGKKVIVPADHTSVKVEWW